MITVPSHLYEKGLSLTVKGQPQIYNRIAKALHTAQSGISWQEGRAKHSFLFLGPTGVGKTETAKCINYMLFGIEQKLITFDMGNYQTPETVPLFIETFYEVVSAAPPSVILFDEIEKAAEDITTLLLAMLDEGRFTANKKQISLQNHYLIFTSNLGCKAIIDTKQTDFATIERLARSEAEAYFRPEIVARFGTVMVFNLLQQDTQKEIAQLFLEQFLAKNRDVVRAAYSPEVISYLRQKGTNVRMGARPLKNCIEQYVGFALANRTSDSGCLVVENNTIVFQSTTEA